MVPKTEIAAHARPTAPLLPRVRDSAVDDPIRDVRAVISTRLPPKLRRTDSKIDESDILEKYI